MIGQENLLRSLDKLIENKSMSRFSIIIGERGSESEDVGRVIAQRLECPYVMLPDVKVDTVRSMIKEAYKQHEKLVYIIRNADDMSINAKNALLKVTEEPPYRAYFVMCLEDINNTLTTIKSRGTTFYMDRCKPNDLAEFAESLYVDKEDIDEKEIGIIRDVCSTPGDVLMLMKYGPSKFYEYVEHIARDITEVSGAEMFTLFDKLAYKDEEDKYDCTLFLKAFQNVVLKSCDGFKAECNRYCNCKTIAVTSNFLQDLRVKGINKQMLIECWALEVRKVWKSQS